MKRNRAFHRVGFALLCGILLFLNGCGDKPQSYNIVLECDEVVAKKSVRVDLIPVSSIDLPEWQAYAVSKYWQPGNSKRTGTEKITRNFGFGQPKSYVLKESDPEIKTKWKAWINRRVSHIVVIADLDSVTDDSAGNADPRRKVIPLNKKSWPDTSTLRILIQDGGVRVDGLEKLPKST